VLRVPADEVAPAKEPEPAPPASRLEEVRRQWRKNQPTYERDPAERYHVDDGDPEPPRRRERDPEQAPERSRSRRSQREDDDDDYRMQEDEEERRPKPPRKRRKAWKTSTTEHEPMFTMPWHHLQTAGILLFFIFLILTIYVANQNGYVLTPRGYSAVSLLVIWPIVHLIRSYIGEET
jgi:hypothetical protein